MVSHHCKSHTIFNWLETKPCDICIYLTYLVKNFSNIYIWDAIKYVLSDLFFHLAVCIGITTIVTSFFNLSVPVWIVSSYFIVERNPDISPLSFFTSNIKPVYQPVTPYLFASVFIQLLITSQVLKIQGIKKTLLSCGHQKYW